MTERLRLYHLVVVYDSGAKAYLTRYPMTHAECRVMKSKSSHRTQARTMFEEAHNLACVGVVGAYCNRVGV